MNESTRVHLEQNLPFRDRFHFALQRARGIPIETDLSPYQRVVERILNVDLTNITDNEITARAAAIRSDVVLSAATTGHPAGARLQEHLVEAFALASEAAWRVLGERMFPVQLATAIVLHRRKLAQMNTGEGKTLAAVPAAFLNSLTGRGVHILTANDYLARRDATWMCDVYALLGCWATFVNDDTRSPAKREAYGADVVYLTAKRAGFDFLSDQLSVSTKDLVQRGFHMAIVDEADSILIDESRVPLVIASESDRHEIDPILIDKVARGLQAETDFVVDRTGRNCVLTIAGQKVVQRELDCPGIEDAEGVHFHAAVNVALHAHHLLSVGEDYIVRDDRIELVDEFTGRVADQRRWPYGIQTALEAKEGLELQLEGRVSGSITVQHFLDRYPHLAGMTATATPSAKELNEFYGLVTVVIPPNRQSRLVREPDRVFTTKRAKLTAVGDRIAVSNQQGRPVLVGTRTISESEELAELIRGRGIECSVLNAQNDEQEAQIVSGAGAEGAVTISTNMAGRGTDIRLGGSHESGRDRVAELGGLLVIGTNRHESRRIDEQLAGRAGRQGDPGSASTFVSLEDDLIQRYAILDFVPAKYRDTTKDDEITDPVVAKEIRRAQSIIEAQHHSMRRTLRQYSELVESQRKIVEGLRTSALNSAAVPDEVLELCHVTEPVDSDRSDALSVCYIAALDSAWADYLEWIGTLREGIHLRRYAGRNPLLEFVESVSLYFDDMLESVDRDAVRRYEEWLASGDVDLDQIKRPSSTWTYLINDDPFPRFSLSGVASGNVLAAASSALFAPLWAAVSVLQGIASGRWKRRRSTR